MANIILNLIIMVASLTGLVKFSEWMIDGAVAVAKKYGISPLILGATVVAMGTSLAELAVNMVEIFSGHGTEAILGNVLGSNFVNIGLGLGIASIIATITAHFVVIEKEIPIYFAVTALLTSFAGDGVLTRMEGIALVLSFIIINYLIYQYSIREKSPKEKSETKKANKEFSHEEHIEHEIPFKKALMYLILGLFGLVISARILVSSASIIALSLGISKYIIGLTIVGVGTSFPEIMASVQAARKGYTDIVLGNVFGSNIFNICFGLGVPMLIKNVEVKAAALNDLYFMNIVGILIMFLLLIEAKIVGKNKSFDKFGGVVIVLVYLGYILFKILSFYKII
jgi:cation:H+ antiporter